MTFHIFHDDGLWSPPHAVNSASLELRQYSTCKLCGRIRYRTIGLAAHGRFDSEIADCNRTETLQALRKPVLVDSPVGDAIRQLEHTQERQRERICRVEELANAIKGACGL